MVYEVFLLALFYLIIPSINSSSFAKEKRTFIFDFDETVYSKDKYRSYLRILINQGAKSNNLNKQQILELKKFNEYSPKTLLQCQRLIVELEKKFRIRFSDSDVRNTVKLLNFIQTKGLGEIIQKLISQGDDVLIVGGGSLGCAVIPKFVSQFGVKQSNVYSGYFKNFSDENYYVAMSDKKAKYSNCEDVDMDTPLSDKKSDLIRFLKKRKLLRVG